MIRAILILVTFAVQAWLFFLKLNAAISPEAYENMLKLSLLASFGLWAILAMSYVKMSTIETLLKAPRFYVFYPLMAVVFVIIFSAMKAGGKLTGEEFITMMQYTFWPMVVFMITHGFVRSILISNHDTEDKQFG